MNKRYSLKRNKDFRYVYNRGKSVACHLMVLIYAPNRDRRLRVGFSVGKKVGNAVARNRVKRRMREIFRMNMDAVPAGYNYILIARAPIIDAKYLDIDHHFKRLLAKTGLRKHEKPPGGDDIAKDTARRH